METVSEKEAARRKRAIFESMSARGQKAIMKRGYDNWDPFEEPKDPIDMRTERTKRTSQMLVREFLQSVKPDDYTNDYGRGVLEICMGIINDDERFKGMYDFAIWYHELLKREGYESESL